MKKKKKQKNTIKVQNDRATRSQIRLDTLISNGIYITGLIRTESLKHYIGEKIVINRRIELPDGNVSKTLGGVVVGLYPHFLLLDCGNYKTSITYKDLVLGGCVS